MKIESAIDNLLLHIRDYVEERVKLVSLNLHDKGSRTASAIASAIVLFLIGIFTLFFLILALSWCIGTLLHEPFAGFLIVGLFYVLTGIIIYINRDKWIRIPVSNG